MKKLNKKTYLLIGIVAILLLAAILLTRGGPVVDTVKVQPGNISRTVEDVGYVQPATDYNFQATQSARVIRVPVETGQFVKQGQTLVVLENLDLAVQLADIRSQLLQAEATVSGTKAALERTELELKDAQENLARIEELFQAGAVTQAEFDKARLLVETYQRSLSEQQARLSSARSQITGYNQTLQQLATKEQQLVLKSPVDGIVLSLPVKPEQVLQPGALLASVAVPGQLEVKADILSDDLAEVKEGQKVNVTAPVLGQKVLVGEVKKIYPRAEEKQSALGVVQRRVPVIISLSESNQLKPGYEVRVAIEVLNWQNVLVVPREAVRTTKSGQKEVMVVVNKRVQHRPVQTGISDREHIEITAGLEAGMEIVKDGSLDLAEKTRIKPKESDK
ncbi:MAG: efflux RND transporter periplasmic adaptor subunit [Firmicutes bacterium]|nr:efflux RND transporter periplasmic adaptor subunit [Bacillota bacterium]